METKPFSKIQGKTTVNLTRLVERHSLLKNLGANLGLKLPKKVCEHATIQQNCRLSMMEVRAKNRKVKAVKLRTSPSAKTVFGSILSWSYITDHILRESPGESSSSWWLNQHLLKNMLVKLDHFPKDRGENKKKWVATTQVMFFNSLGPSVQDKQFQQLRCRYLLAICASRP